MPDSQHFDPLDRLDARITRALDDAPAPSIPAGFAARTAALAHARFGALPAPQASTPNFGIWTIRISLALLFAAMLLVTRFAATSATSTILLEFTLSAEFIALSLYLTLRPNFLR